MTHFRGCKRTVPENAEEYFPLRIFALNLLAACRSFAFRRAGPRNTQAVHEPRYGPSR